MKNIRQEVLVVLREYYTIMLRDYEGQICTDIAPILANQLASISPLHAEVMNFHRDLNPDVCMAKAVLEKVA